MISGLEDVLAVNLTLVGVRLLDSPESKVAFERIVNTSVVDDVATTGLALRIPGQQDIELAPAKFRMPKERVTLDLAPGRSIVAREYPQEEDLDKFAGIIRNAFDKSDTDRQQLQAYGFNIEAVYNLDQGKTALEFLATQIFAKDIFPEGEYTVIGGAPQIQVLHKGGLWNINIQPRMGKSDSDKIFIALNKHCTQSKLPSPFEIRNSLADIWTQAHEIGAIL